MLDKAIRIAASAFEGKFDKGGKPYILHCLHVMNDVHSNNEEVKCAAVLHDLFEDCENEGWNEEKLIAEGMSHRVCVLVRLLTHKPAISYEEYIRQISFDYDASEIKKADLRHNSNITRLKDVRKKDFDRLQRYSLAYKYLSN